MFHKEYTDALIDRFSKGVSSKVTDDDINNSTVQYYGDFSGKVHENNIS